MRVNLVLMGHLRECDTCLDYDMLVNLVVRVGGCHTYLGCYMLVNLVFSGTCVSATPAGSWPCVLTWWSGVPA